VGDILSQKEVDALLSHEDESDEIYCSPPEEEEEVAPGVLRPTVNVDEEVDYDEENGEYDDDDDDSALYEDEEVDELTERMLQMMEEEDEYDDEYDDEAEDDLADAVDGLHGLGLHNHSLYDGKERDLLIPRDATKKELKALLEFIVNVVGIDQSHLDNFDLPRRVKRWFH